MFMRLGQIIGSYFKDNGHVFELTYKENDIEERVPAGMPSAGKKSYPPETDYQHGVDQALQRVVKLIPYETTLTYFGMSKIVINGTDDYVGNVFVFLSCLIVTALVRAPLLSLPGDRKQTDVYILNLFISCFWVYSIGGYLIDIHPRDDTFASAFLLLFGIILPVIPSKFGNPK
jgi:hypothetical protein